MLNKNYNYEAISKCCKIKKTNGINCIDKKKKCTKKIGVVWKIQMLEA